MKALEKQHSWIYIQDTSMAKVWEKNWGGVTLERTNQQVVGGWEGNDLLMVGIGQKVISQEKNFKEEGKVNSVKQCREKLFTGLSNWKGGPW